MSVLHFFCGLHLKNKSLTRCCVFIISFRSFSNAKSTAKTPTMTEFGYFGQFFKSVQEQNQVQAQASTIFKITN